MLSLRAVLKLYYNYLFHHDCRQIVQKCDPIHIRLQGVDIMNDDPSSAKVLYAKIAPNEALQKIVDEIMNYFAEIGKRNTLPADVLIF